MAAGSGSGRRLLAISAVCCAVFGLVVAAGAMPMVASESPANDFLDDGEDRAGPEGALAQDGGDGSDGGGSGSGDGASSPGGGAGELAGGTPGGALAERAAASDNPLVRGALYGLASLASLFGAPGGVPDAGNAAAAGIDGEFGSQLDEPPESGAATLEDAALREGADAGDLEGGSYEPGSGGETTTATETAAGDGTGGETDGATGDGETSTDGTEPGSGPDGSGTAADADGDGTDAEADGSSDEEAATGGDGSATADGGSSEPAETGDEGGSESGTGGGEPAAGDGQSSDGADGSTAEPGTEPDSASLDDPEATDSSDRDGTSEESGDEDGTAEDAGGGDESTDDGEADGGLEDALPGLSDGAVTAALAALALAVVGYVFYTRDDPIGTLRSIPGRLVSLALTVVVACSQGLERAVGRLRELRSLAELPGLIATTVAAALRSATARARDVGASLSPFGTAADADETAAAETRVTARERIRRAFESVIDAAPIYRGRVATATPADVARRATEAGAPGEPVEAITDAFRDVEYGDRDPDAYLDRTTAAHDRLRSALEAADESTDARPVAGVTDSAEPNPTAARTEADADE